MSREGKTKTIESNVRRAGMAVLATVALVGCGSANKHSSDSMRQAEVAHSASSNQPPQASYSRVDHGPNGLRFTFYSLGDGTENVRTLTHPGGNGVVPEVAREYKSGETVRALCKTVGNAIQAETRLGDVRRYSDWVLVKDDEDGELGYATVVYAENPDYILSQLDQCDADIDQY